MATFTPFLNLRKPVNADLVSVASDISANMDLIDTGAISDDARLDTLEALNAAEAAATWTTYVPVISGGGTPITLGNGTLTGKYKLQGKNVIGWQVTLVVGSTTVIAAGALTTTLPNAIQAIAANQAWGNYMQLAPNKQGLIRATNGTNIQVYEVTTTAVATIASLAIVTGTTLIWSGGSHETP